MTLRALLLAGCLAGSLACFGKGNYLPEPPDPLDLNVRTLSDNPARMYNTERAWRYTPWARITDGFGPFYVVVADDGAACVVDAKTWAVVQPRQSLSCKTRWRLPRP